MIFELVERDKLTKVSESRGKTQLSEGDRVVIYDKNGEIGVLTMMGELKVELILETDLDET